METDSAFTARTSFGIPATVPSSNRRAVPYSDDPAANRKERRRRIDERRRSPAPSVTATPTPVPAGGMMEAGGTPGPLERSEWRRPIRHVLLLGNGGKPTESSGEQKSCDAPDDPLTPSVNSRTETPHRTLPGQLQQATMFCNQSQLRKLQSYLPRPKEETAQHSTAAATATQQFLAADLQPASIPKNPLDDELENASPTMKEMAWVLEESAVMLPPTSNAATSKEKLVLDFAWKHGSLRLREYLSKAHPSEVSTMVKRLKCEASKAKSGLGDKPTVVEFVGCSQGIFCRLRGEARNALRLGYRRSEAIEKELNGILYSRWKDAVEELGEADRCSIPDPFKPKKTRHSRRRRRSKHDALVETALGQDKTSTVGSQPVNVQAATLEMPPELTLLEDEVAWLVEESLILLPADMLTNSKETKCFMTAGLVTKSCEIKWDYVATHASEELKREFARMGGLKRRPLQRLIRYHQKEVRVSFAKRRDDIASLLLLQGYRRPLTKDHLPSHELLVTTGLNKVWAVRLLRRRQNEQSESIASSEDLRLACNQRIGYAGRSETSPKRHKKRSPKKPKLAATQKAQSLILSADEEEIAWLQEEYKNEFGVPIYDWEYIEENSSVPLLISLAERKVAPSIFPSVPGVSKLSAMVRLDDTRVKEEYDRIRADIRYAITQKGFRRDRSQHLPAIPSAPESFHQRPKRKTCVVDVEYANRSAKDSSTRTGSTNCNDGKRKTCVMDLEYEPSTGTCTDVSKGVSGSKVTSNCSGHTDTGWFVWTFDSNAAETTHKKISPIAARALAALESDSSSSESEDEDAASGGPIDSGPPSKATPSSEECLKVNGGKGEAGEDRSGSLRALKSNTEEAKGPSAQNGAVEEQDEKQSESTNDDKEAGDDNYVGLAAMDSFELNLSGEESGDEIVNDDDEEFLLPSDESEDEESIEE